jgi:6,7-dimethyl-8-ribityllumazine synthase
VPATLVYDANVLYPNTLRDLLIRLARIGLVRARWTEQILDEMAAALLRTRPDIQQSTVERLRGRKPS